MAFMGQYYDINPANEEMIQSAMTIVALNMGIVPLNIKPGEAAKSMPAEALREAKRKFRKRIRVLIKKQKDFEKNHYRCLRSYDDYKKNAYFELVRKIRADAIELLRGQK